MKIGDISILCSGWKIRIYSELFAYSDFLLLTHKWLKYGMKTLCTVSPSTAKEKEPQSAIWLL